MKTEDGRLKAEGAELVGISRRDALKSFGALAAGVAVGPAGWLGVACGVRGGCAGCCASTTPASGRTLSTLSAARRFIWSLIRSPPPCAAP